MTALLRSRWSVACECARISSAFSASIFLESVCFFFFLSFCLYFFLSFFLRSSWWLASKEISRKFHSVTFVSFFTGRDDPRRDQGAGGRFGAEAATTRFGEARSRSAAEKNVERGRRKAKDATRDQSATNDAVRPTPETAPGSAASRPPEARYIRPGLHVGEARLCA